MTSLDRPFTSFWKDLQDDWGYPTIIGAHDELAQWSSGLRMLAERLEETLDFIERDLERRNGRGSTADAGVEYACSTQQIFLVGTAAQMLQRAADLAVARFPT